MRLREWINRFVIALRSLRRGNAHRVLQKRLKAAEIAPGILDLERGYRIFMDFCQIPIWADSDGVLVQWQTIQELLGEWPYIKQGDTIGFEFHVLRQFDDGRQMGYEQLSLIWRYPLDDYLNTLDIGRSEWCFAEQGCQHEDLLQKQAKSELFQHLKQQKPYETIVYQQTV